MQACARWGMCLAGLLGQHCKCVWGNEGRKVLAQMVGYPLVCTETNQLVSLTARNKNLLFKWPVPEIWTRESKGVC